MAAHLVSLHEQSTTLLQPGAAYTFGRSNIQGLEGVKGVSKIHLTVRSVNGQFEVVDAGSRNGTFVNGDRIEDSRPLACVAGVLDLEPQLRYPVGQFG